MRIVFVLLAYCLATVPARAVEVQVYAAASLRDVLRDVAAARAGTGDALVFNFAGSNVLALQIQAGAPADVFFSADARRMDALEANGLLRPGTRHDVLTNRLVVVVPASRPSGVRSPQDLLGVRRLALAETRSVPAGVYARQYLEGAGLWATLRDRVVPTENVRAALAAVESGNVDAGIVYATDARASKRVRVAFEIEDGPHILYPVAVLQRARQPEAALRFVEFLSSDAARTVFEAHGFGLLAREP